MNRFLLNGCGGGRVHFLLLNGFRPSTASPTVLFSSKFSAKAKLKDSTLPSNDEENNCKIQIDFTSKNGEKHNLLTELDGQEYTKGNHGPCQQVYYRWDSWGFGRSSYEWVTMCTEVTENGEIRYVRDRSVKNSLCSLHGIEMRDIRKLDGTLRNQLPVILARPPVILVNMHKIRAVIKSNVVIFFEDQSEKNFQLRLISDLREKLKLTFPEDELSFEIKVLELILTHVCQSLQCEFDELSPTFDRVLAEFEGKQVSWEKLQSVLQLKKKLRNFKARVEHISDCIAEVLNSDDDMSAMYLTNKGFSPHNPRPVSEHSEVEMILESYLKLVHEIGSRLQEMEDNLESTEEIVSIGLEGQRNELILLELKLTMGTLAAGVGGFGASVFGMNLRSYLETHPSFFYIVAGTLFMTSYGVYRRCYRQLVRVLGKR